MRLARLMAGGFGMGRAPVAPGTVGSAVAVLAGAGLMRAPPGVLSLAAAAASLGGLWAIRKAEIEGDPGWVVIDEVAGQWITLLGLAQPSPLGLMAGFLLFRVMDIGKPGPVGWADRQGGATGIMADDLIAGALSAAVLWAIRTRWPWVFV